MNGIITALITLMRWFLVLVLYMLFKLIFMLGLKITFPTLQHCNRVSFSLMLLDIRRFCRSEVTFVTSIGLGMSLISIIAQIEF